MKSTPELLRVELLRQPVSQVAFEACSQAGWVHDLCEELKLPAKVAGTCGAAWQWKRIKRKTDKDDALKLARLASIGGIESVPVPPRAIRQWKSLIGLRKRLVSERVRCQNRIRGVLVCQGLPAPLGAKAWTVLGLAGIGQFARTLAECGPEDLWRGELDRLLDRHRFLDGQTREIVSKLDSIVALARKLLVRCWAILRTGQPWKSPAVEAAAPAAVRDNVRLQATGLKWGETRSHPGDRAAVSNGVTLWCHSRCPERMRPRGRIDPFGRGVRPTP